MRRGSVTAVGMVVIGLLVVGCTLDPQAADPRAEVTADAEVPGDADAPDDADTPEDPEVPGDAEAPAAVVCDTSVVEAIDATIAGQLAAFAADDYDAALDFASSTFRAGTDAASFRRLVREGYATLTDDASHRSSACRQLDRGGVALIRVEVTGAGGTRDDHLYLMVEEDDRWLIQGVDGRGGLGGTIA